MTKIACFFLNTSVTFGGVLLLAAALESLTVVAWC